MSSEKQIRANQLNAAKSTGPKRKVGKEASSKNAIKHGLLAFKTLLPWENKSDLEKLRTGLIINLLPKGELEQILVERIVSLSWRLRRTGSIETAIFALRRYLEDHNRAKENADAVTRILHYHYINALNSTSDNASSDQKIITEPELKAEIEVIKKKLLLNSELAKLGRNFIDSTESLSSLHRYEAGIERSFFKALHELQRLQAMRQGQVIPVPLTIDVHGDGG